MESNLSKAKKIFVTVGIATICGALILGSAVAGASEESVGTGSASGTEIVETVVVQSFNKEGYTDKDKWKKALAKSKANRVKKIDKIQKSYKSYLSKNQKKSLKKYKKAIKKAKTIKSSKKYDKKIDKVLKSAKAKKKEMGKRYKDGPSKSYFRSAGVIYHNGHRFTYYSSRVLYHYRTSEWHTDDKGMYRTSDGYLVVAADFVSHGSIVSTPWGLGKVLDCGAGSNTVDCYVSW